MTEEEALDLIEEHARTEGELPYALCGRFKDLLQAESWSFAQRDEEGMYLALPFGNVYIELEDTEPYVR